MAFRLSQDNLHHSTREELKEASDLFCSVPRLLNKTSVFKNSRSQNKIKIVFS